MDAMQAYLTGTEGACCDPENLLGSRLMDEYTAVNGQACASSTSWYCSSRTQASLAKRRWATA